MQRDGLMSVVEVGDLIHTLALHPQLAPCAMSVQHPNSPRPVHVFLSQTQSQQSTFFDGAFGIEFARFLSAADETDRHACAS